MGRLILEHIDPRWVGAPYQLVCGLECDLNEIIAENSYNCRKTNRFVPYRVKQLPAPVTFGDMGEFLIKGDWLVCEFGGPEWMEESTKIGCSQRTGGVRAAESFTSESQIHAAKYAHVVKRKGWTKELYESVSSLYNEGYSTGYRIAKKLGDIGLKRRADRMLRWVKEGWEYDQLMDPNKYVNG